MGGCRRQGGAGILTSLSFCLSLALISPCLSLSLLRVRRDLIIPLISEERDVEALALFLFPLFHLLLTHTQSTRALFHSVCLPVCLSFCAVCPPRPVCPASTLNTHTHTHTHNHTHTHKHNQCVKGLPLSVPVPPSLAKDSTSR